MGNVDPEPSSPPSEDNEGPIIKADVHAALDALLSATNPAAPGDTAPRFGTRELFVTRWSLVPIHYFCSHQQPACALTALEYLLERPPETMAQTRMAGLARRFFEIRGINPTIPFEDILLGAARDELRGPLLDWLLCRD
jgi:hypothetical protein